MHTLTISIFTKTLMVLAVFAIALSAHSTAHAVTGGYIKIDDVKGESTERNAEAGGGAGVSADTRTEDEEAVFCTMDAYQCPNGEWIGRTGPNCEFVCSDGPVNEREPEVVENEDEDKGKDDADSGGEDEEDSNRDATPGVRLVPSQPRVLIMPATGDGDEPIELAGVEIDFRDEDSDDDGLSDGTESMAGSGVSVNVNGVIVRGWNPEIKEEVRARLQEADDQNSANDFGLFVALQAIDNEEIETIEVAKTRTTIIFETKVRLLGFIPVNVTAEAIAEGNGEARVSYPWWSFLARKSEREKDTTMSDVATRIAIEEEGVPAVHEKHN